MPDPISVCRIHAAFLDQYHPRTHSIIIEAMPKNWSARFALSRSPEDQEAAVAEAQVLFVMAAPVTKTIIQCAPNLQLIQKLGSGVDRIDHDACAERDIAVARLAGGNSIQVAEHTLLLILAALRRLPVMDRRTRAGEWPKEEARGICRQLHGKRVGLVGLGAIGRALVKLLSGFEVEIVYYDPVVPSNGSLQPQARFLPLDELIATCDILSLHLPLFSNTAGLIDEARIRLMKPGAVVINCSRGGLVDEAALAQALSEGRLFAAGIDTFCNEPPVSSPLLLLDQVVVTPHIAAATVDNFSLVMERAVRNASIYFSDGKLSEEDIVFLPGRAFLTER